MLSRSGGGGGDDEKGGVTKGCICQGIDRHHVFRLHRGLFSVSPIA